MAVLYIKEQGAFVHRHGERIIVTRNRMELLDIPVFQVDNIAIIGNVQISTQALQMLMDKGVDVSYFSFSGKHLGNTSAESSKNIFLRFQQYMFYLNEGRRIHLAQTIVRGKIENQIRMINNYRWDKSENPEYEHVKDVSRMRSLADSIPSKKTTQELMGIEGLCSKIYFNAFGKMLKCEFSFHGRNRRPPKDPVNIILSLTYTFLTREICSILDAESMEPYLGILHGIRYGRKSLALDLIEEFRQPLADRFTIMLFNRHIISSEYFEQNEDMPVLLNEDGFHKFCNEYEKWMNGHSSYSLEKNYRSRIHEQISLLKKVFMGEAEYVPYQLRHYK